MDILQVQDRLKNFSQDQLVGEMQAPSGNAPQFLVLSEIMRRKRMQDDFAAQQGKAGAETTVAQEAIASAGVPQGGIADMARAMAPSTDMTQNTGVQAMASGGTVKKMAEGDVVVRGGIQYTEQADGTYLSEDGTRSMLSPGQEISRDFSSLLSIPQGLGSLFGNASAGMADEANATLMDQYRASQGRSAATMRAGPDTSYQYPEVPTVDVTDMERAALAEDVMSGRAGPQTGFPSAYEQYVQNQIAAVDAAQPRFPPEAFNPMATYGMRAGPQTGLPEAGPSMPPPVSLDRAAAYRAASEVQPAPAPSFEGLDRRAQFEPVGEGMGLSYLPPEMDAASFARRSMAARPLSEILTPEVLSREETVREINRMGLVGAGAPRPPEPQEDPMTVAARESAEKAATERAAAGKTQSLETPAEGAAAAKAAREATQGEGEVPAAPQGGGGGSGIAGAASGMTSYEQELMDALARREQAATQDKWLALAQVGLNLMSSDQPTFGGALGEAGLAGVQAAQGARDQYEKDRLDLTGALEQSRMSRAKAAADAAKGAGGSSDGLGGFSISAGQGRLLTQINTDIERLDTMLNDPMLMGAELTPDQEMAMADAAAQRDQLVRYRQGLLYGAPLGTEEDDTNIEAADE